MLIAVFSHLASSLCSLQTVVWCAASPSLAHAASRCAWARSDRWLGERLLNTLLMSLALLATIQGEPDEMM